MKNSVQVFRTMALTLDDADFETAFQLMCEERNDRRQRRMMNNKVMLSEGSIVEWASPKSGSCTGEVVRIKTKKAIVKQTSSGRHQNTNWDIPMSMLKVVG